VLNYVFYIVFLVRALVLLMDYVLYDPLCIMTIFVVLVNFMLMVNFTKLSEDR
jgi:hypothetical protein